MARSDSKLRPTLVGLTALLLVVAGSWIVVDHEREGAPAPGHAPPLAEPAVDRPSGAQEPTAHAAETRTPDAASTSRNALDARLVATVVRADETKSFAAIARLDGTMTQLFGLGESLASDPSATLVAIGDGYVDIDHAGTRVRLASSSRLDEVTEKFLAAMRNAPRREPSREERERRRAMSERLRARIEAGPGSGTRVRGAGIIAEGRARARYKGDRLEAIEIDQIEPDGFYDQLGLQEGDRIRSINGIPVGDPDAAGLILQELVTAKEIVADVGREGGDSEVAIPSGEIMDILQEQLTDLSADELAEIAKLPIEWPTPEAEKDGGELDSSTP